MTIFIDGPAQGQHLTLKRAPTFLRVVRDPSGKWDALDLPEDMAKPEEDVYVYQLVSEPGIAHYHRRRPLRSGWSMIAEYRLCPEQHLYAHDNSLWVEWVMSHTHLCTIRGKELAPHLR